ncbi:MAG: hypothetical protein AAFO02_14205, partial [Bacteroidota bacterium]
PAGIYTLTVTDSDTCRAIFPGLRIPEPNLALAVDGMTDSVSCFGFADGSIMANVMGGDMPYELRWRRNGNLIPSLQGLELEDLIAADYELEVTDSNGCVVSTEFVVDGPEEILIDIINDPLGVDSLVAMVSGGMPPYEFLWSNGDTTAVITDLASANYQILVTDASGCIAEQSFVLTNNTTPFGQQGNIRLFPNPTNGLLRLQLEDFPPELRVEVQWYNNLGQPIGETRSIESLSAMDFDLGSWPAGTYWLRLLDVKTGQYWSTKVIRL